MPRAMRAMAAVAVVLLLLIPTVVQAESPGPLGSTIDDHLGQVSDDLENANATYGDREEFQKARFELQQGAGMLLSSATLLAEDHLIRAQAAIATGRLRAQAQGSANPSEEVINRAEEIASQADELIIQVRSDLRTMERTGLEPVAFDGGLTVAHTLIRAMELSQDHRIALNAWEDGDHSPSTEAQVVSGAIGALRIATVAQDLLADVAEARQDARVQPFVSHDRLQRLADQRVNWTEGKGGPALQSSQARVDAFHRAGDQLLTLAASMIFVQNLASNGLLTEYEQGRTDPLATAINLYNATAGDAEGWVERYDLPGGLVKGALASAQIAIASNTNVSQDRAARNGATAAGFVHLAEEHAGLIQQGLGNIFYEPGGPIVAADTQAEQTSDLPLWLAGVALLVLLVIGTVVFVRRQG